MESTIHLAGTLQAAIGAEAIGERLIANGIIALIAVCVSYLTFRVLVKEKLRKAEDDVVQLRARHDEADAQLRARLNEQRGEITQLTTAVSDGQVDRANCQVKATRTFATQGQFVGVIHEINSARQDVSEKIGRAHGRMDGLAKDVHTLAGEVQAMKANKS